jgi:formylglycine-generating enzyme required for sulfatase activity
MTQLASPSPRRSVWFSRWLPVVAALVALGGAALCAFGAEAAPASPPAAASAPPAGQPHLIRDLGLSLLPVPAGKFMMGSSYSEPGRRDDEVEHMVTLTRPFWLGRTPVTQGQYTRLMGTNPSRYKDQDPDLPVETVSWDEAIAFCRKLTERERAAGRLPAGHSYTLPTEAQREYACRAGSPGRYAGELNAIAWYSGNSDDKPQPVARKQPNAWGLHDMQGNVWEWCRDWYGNYPSDSVTDPTGPASGSQRVYRGGAWFHSAELCRSASRYRIEPTYRGSLLGFRIALTADDPAR